MPAAMARSCNVSLTTFGICALAVGLVIATGGWLLAMFGHGFEAGYVSLVILAVGVLARVIAGPVEDILNMTGHSGLSAWAYLALIVPNVALAVALVIPFGIVGAALASVCALALRAVWLYIAVPRRLHIDASIFAGLTSRAASPGGARLTRPAVQAPAE